MHKTAIRQFAIYARKALLQAVSQRAYYYRITPDNAADPKLTHLSDCDLTETEAAQWRQLIAHIRANGFAQTMEETAYTWFNRLTALRFMEVNGYLPSRVRIFSDAQGTFRPEILSEAMYLEWEGLDRAKILDLLEQQKNEALYKYLLISQCHALHACLPEVFGEIGGWTELLFPDNLLRSDSVIAHLVEDIPEDDWKEQVQIIGWLYQYYQTEPKEQIFSDLKRNIKLTAQTIPAATQLFTPDWIVRFMVENSLGRLWSEGHGKPEDADWRYALEEAVQPENIHGKLSALRDTSGMLRPEDIRVLDPCMGSGHVLVYAFDVLMQIYTSCGWSERDAARAILEHNLYGLDLDRRAYQLACFALMMKARQYDRRILRDQTIRLHLANFADAAPGSAATMSDAEFTFSEQFKDADLIGSLLLIDMPEAIKPGSDPAAGMMVRCGEILSQQYDVVITNPPYMGASGMNETLSGYVKQHFPDSKSDLFACFMERGLMLTKEGGFQCMVTMQSWMFLKSFEQMRVKLLHSYTLTSMLHMDHMVMDIAFGTAVSCFRKVKLTGYKGTYLQIHSQDIEDGVPRSFPAENRCIVHRSAERFARLPGCAAAYWISDAFQHAFECGVLLGSIADCKQGIATADNRRFLRLWHEVERGKLLLGCKSHAQAAASPAKWYPYNKGGNYRKWYGNQDHVVNWAQDGAELRGFRNSVIRNSAYFFRECFSWSLVSSGAASFRYKPAGQLFDVAGMCCFSEKELYVLLGLCNSVIGAKALEVIAPTINYQCGDIANIPVLFPENDDARERIGQLVQENIRLCKEDWDSCERSYDFEAHPLL